jgi:hypothetical protein
VGQVPTHVDAGRIPVGARRSEGLRGDLDHDAVDASGEPRDRRPSCAGVRRARARPGGLRRGAGAPGRLSPPVPGP